jgi:hypothetical protein
MRIAALKVRYFSFPKQGSFLHGVIFPLYIYIVFILWLIWVRKFSRYVKNNNTEFYNFFFFCTILVRVLKISFDDPFLNFLKKILLV